MRYVFACLVLLVGLEGFDQSLFERDMETMKPPREPIELRALTEPPPVPDETPLPVTVKPFELGDFELGAMSL